MDKGWLCNGLLLALCVIFFLISFTGVRVSRHIHDDGTIISTVNPLCLIGTRSRNAKLVEEAIRVMSAGLGVQVVEIFSDGWTVRGRVAQNQDRS